MGAENAYRQFCQWTSKREHDPIWSTAKVVFLSKTKNEIVNSHKDYRPLSVQPCFIRILEGVVMGRIDKKKIEMTQFINQSGFTPGRSIKTNLDKLDRKSTRLNSSHSQQSRMPSSA